MIAADVKSLPTSEKLLIMEAIWEDMREQVMALEVPRSHRELLDNRRARVKNGEARVLDWDLVKGSIGHS
jgi:hypothetical protein